MAGSVSTDSALQLEDRKEVVDDKEQDVDGLVKLKVEAATPFRLFRQFVYLSIGLAGGIGTVTATPQLILALQQNDADITTKAINVAIDVGGVLSAVLFSSVENKNQKEIEKKFREKQLMMSNRISPMTLKENEDFFSKLPVEIQINEENDNATRIVSMSDLQSKGNQNVIIVAGDIQFVKDAIISARLEGTNLFTDKDTMVIPFVLEDDKQFEDEIVERKGFGISKDVRTEPPLMTAPYIAKPKQVNVWNEYLQQEIKINSKKEQKNLIKSGIIIAVRKSGKIMKRGIGLPPWKDLVNELSKKESK